MLDIGYRGNLIKIMEIYLSKANEMNTNGYQYYLPLKTDKSIPVLYYRIHLVQYSDGTVRDILQYYSTCGGGWMYSMEDDYNSFIINSLIKI